MKHLLFILLITILGVSCSQKKWDSDAKEIVLYKNVAFGNLVPAILITPITSEIIQVSVSATNLFSKENLIQLSANSPVEFDVIEKDDKLLISTVKVKLELSIVTGEIQFFDDHGNLLFHERTHCENNKETNEADVSKVGSFQQVFQTNTEEVLYVVDQLNENIGNTNHNKQTQKPSSTLYPFVISTQNYGLLLARQTMFSFDDCVSHFKTLPNIGLNNSSKFALISETEKQIDYYFLLGKSMDEVVDNKCFLSGKTELLPRYVFDFLTNEECLESEKQLNNKGIRYVSTGDSFKECVQWEDIKRQMLESMCYSIGGFPYKSMRVSENCNLQSIITTKPDDKILEEWQELNMRTYQMRIFSPLVQIDNFANTETSPSFALNNELLESIHFYNKLRHSLLPYVYSIAASAYYSNYTAVRSLPMDFSDDRRVFNIDDQIMFGPYLLVNPVSEYHARKRDVYFPNYSGWFNLYTGEYLAGGQIISVDAPYNRIPVFIREGSIIPVQTQKLQKLTEANNSYTIFIYTGKDASFSLYEDDGISTAYKNGESSIIKFQYSEKDKTLTINNRKGTFLGMPEHQTFNIIKVSRNKPVAFLDSQIKAEEISYSGKKTIVNL